MPASLTLTGLREAQAALRALAQAAPTVVSAALVKAAEPVRDRLVDDAPRVTGALADSVAIVPHPPRNGRTVVEVRVAVDYAAHVDLGTHRITPEYFAERAADATADRARAIAAREIARSLGP